MLTTDSELHAILPDLIKRLKGADGHLWQAVGMIEDAREAPSVCHDERSAWPATTRADTPKSILRMDIVRAPIGRDRPVLDGVVVIVGSKHMERGELFQRRLDVAGPVHAAAP